MQKLIIYILLILNFQFLLSQKPGQIKIDSLIIELPKAREDSNKVNLLNEICLEMRLKSNFIGSKKYCDEALQLAVKIKFKDGIADANYNIGIIYMYLSDYSKSLEYFQKAVKLFEELGNKPMVADIFSNSGIVYANLGDSQKSIEYLQRALEINEKSNDKNLEANDLRNLGAIYSNIKQYTKAQEYFQKVLEIRENLGNKKDIAFAISDIANVYDQLNNRPKTLECLLKALGLYEEVGNKEKIAFERMSIANFYLQKMSDKRKANEYFQKVLASLDEVKSKYSMSSLLRSVAEYYQLIGDYSNARKYLSKGIYMVLEIGSKQLIRETYLQLASLDSAMNNYKGAYINYKLYKQYNDDIFNWDKDKEITTMVMKNEFDKIQDSSKAVQLIKDAVTAKEILHQKVIRNYFLVGLIIVLLFLILVFRQRNRIARQRNKIIEEKQRSDELLLNILPTEVAEELKENGSSKAKSFNEVTVMFTDFKGFTQISAQLGAEKTVAEIDYCFSAFDLIIQKHGIEKIKTIGDAYMCVGGLPKSNSTHAEDIVKAAIEIRDFMADYNQKKIAKGEILFEIRIGINTGPVVAGIVGVKKFAYDIWGDTVNTSARMQQNSEPGKINISGFTYLFVKDLFDCVYRGRIEAKNKGEIDMYFVKDKFNNEL